jgi:hypothetical protein
MAIPEALLAQLKELNERSRTYGRQFWQVPFAYLAALGIAILQAVDGKHPEPALIWTLAMGGVVGGFVLWHLIALYLAAYRSFLGIKDYEGRLSLTSSETQWRAGHLWAFLVMTAAASLAAFLVAGCLLYRRICP